MDIDLKVAQLLASRICHDLAGGVSALSTGAELLAEEGGVPGAEALHLIGSSAQQTAQRLQFLRVAFGLGGGEGGAIAFHELRKVAGDYLESERLSLVWAGGEGRIELGAGKLLLNLLLVAADTLPRGGVVEVQVSPLEGQVGFALAARGEGARLLPELAAALSPDANVEALTPRTVHGHFAAVLARQLGGELEVEADLVAEVRFAALVPLS